MLNYWIITVSEENWNTVAENNIYGAPEAGEVGRVKPAYSLIKPGDVLLFYVVKKSSRKLRGKFAGTFKVTSEWYREDKPLWPDEVREGRVRYPWRMRLEPVRISVADFKEPAPKLKFIENKEMLNTYLVETSANLRMPIPEEDAKIIIESLG